MGILSNTVSIQQYKVLGTLPKEDLDQWLLKSLSDNSFDPIDDSTKELSVGWTRLEDITDTEFDNISLVRRDHYVFFTLRKDQRKVPTALVRNRMKQESDEYLAANPDHNWVPKRIKEEIKDRVLYSLLLKTLPSPATYDVLWNLETGVLAVASLSPKVHEKLEEVFTETFGGMSLVAIHPFARAIDVLDPELLPALNTANKASAEDVLSLIKDNLWIGWDFLLWMLYRTLNSASTYKVSRPGPAVEDEEFVAFLNNRLVLLDQQEDGAQKVTITGPQKDFSEAKKALVKGKKITDATIYMEKNEETWCLTLKGDIFSFGSFKTPAVKLEKDDYTDEAMEREALFFERMALLEKGFQMFDTLYARFLKERLSKGWGNKYRKIQEWLNN